MTTEEYIKKQHEKLAVLASGKPIAIAAQDTHVKMVERIFDDGKQTDGKKNKYNSTDPLYVNPNNSPKKFPTKGKNGDTKFESGEDHKTGYFKSYKDFRSKIGRQTGAMDLQLFGVLRNDFSKGVVKISDLVYVSTVTNEANKGKLEKFSSYFKANKAERENFREVLEYESMNILR
jgi:hypothetical protein